MEDRQFENLLAEADRRRRRGDHRGAVEFAKRALALDPDHARAHAILALSLVGTRRLHGATIEVGLALASDGNDAFCHYAAAVVRRAERRLDDAWSHCLVTLESDVTEPYPYVLAASIRRLQGEPDAARELLDQALALRADDCDTLVAYARVELGAGNLAEAQRRIDAALASEPDDQEAHIAAGMIALQRGELAAAEEHARFALQRNATDHDALHLWTAIKARRSPLLGPWWRFNSFVTLRSQRGMLGLLIGSFIVAQVAIILAGAFGGDDLEALVGYAWLALCAYTWFAPKIFRKMIARELASVTLNPDY
jgi:tetratricopeptide (TPR) repeat protein